MRLSNSQQAELLMDGLGVKDEEMLEEALKAISIHGNYKQALRESIKLEYIKPTMKLLKLCDGDIGELDALAREYEKEFSYHGRTLREIADENSMTYADFSKSIRLTLKDMRIVQTAIEFGGTLEMMKMNLQPNGDFNIKRIKKAIIQADRILSSQKQQLSYTSKLQIQRF